MDLFALSNLKYLKGMVFKNNIQYKTDYIHSFGKEDLRIVVHKYVACFQN